jgi:endonuclease I
MNRLNYLKLIAKSSRFRQICAKIFRRGDHMSAKLKGIIIFGVGILAIFMFVDSYFELGVADSIMESINNEVTQISSTNIQTTDNEAPQINTNNLQPQILLDSDYTIDATCEDNFDEVCVVTIIGTLDTSVLGTGQITLKAEDAAGNITNYPYNYEIVENFDGSIFIPLGYYDSIDGLEGEQLKASLNLIIKDHIEFAYTSSTAIDVWDILREADEDPDNSNNILSFYTGLSIQKDCQDTTYPPDFCEMEAYDETKTVEWNREHIWSKSRGDFSDSSEKGAHTDAHHLVAAESRMNSIKNNRFFEDCNDGDDTNIVDRGYGNYSCNLWEYEPRDEVKGDVARMIFYM